MKRITNTLIQTITPLLVAFALGQDACADVRVVNAAGGAPYTTIQAAVNAAVDGDVILVKPTGNYAGFSVGDKQLSIVGDSPTSQVNVNGLVSVTNVTATRTIVLAKLNITGPVNSTTSSTTRAFYGFGNAGNLRIQQCTIRGGAGTYGYDGGGYPYTTPGSKGIWIENCSGGVALEACTINGGAGQFPDGAYHGLPYVAGSDGADGMYIAGSRLALYDCIVTGGAGGTSYDELYGGNGGAGLHLLATGNAGQLMSSNSTFEGARGGDENFGAFGPSHPGNGGHGLWIGTSAAAWLLDSGFIGGLPGSYLGSSIHGQPGQPILNNGTEIAFQPSKVVMTTPSLVRAQTQMSFTFSGDPGDEIFLLHSGTTSFIGRVSWRGFLLALPTGLYRELVPSAFATIPGSGQVTLSVPAPQLQSLQQGKTVYYQAFRKTSSGSKTLGSFAAVTVVAPGF